MSRDNGKSNGKLNGKSRGKIQTTDSVLGVGETLAGKHLLVTGVTGFLGKIWLTMLLEHVPDVGRVTVLIRSNRKGSAVERFWQFAERSPALRPLRKKLGRERFHAFLEEKVEILEGDCGQPLCGLDEQTLGGLAETLDAVVHFAGLTDFEPDPLLGLLTNTFGGENAADVAARAKVPRFLHISTAFVAGNVSGHIEESIEAGLSPNGTRFDPNAVANELLAELRGLETKRERIDRANEKAIELGWPNIYTLTKGLSEHLHALRDDIDLVLVRPAIVESARNYPFAGWNEGINTSGPLVWLLSSWFRSFPANPKNHFDVVPVDTVARGALLVLAAQLRGEAEGVYHFGSSATNPLTFRRAIDLTALAARRMHSKEGATPFDRLVVKYMDAVPRGSDKDHFPSLPFLRKVAQEGRRYLKDFRPKEQLPDAVYDRWGSALDDKIKKLSMDCRNADRTIGLVEDMLRLYRPFVHDNDYIFANANVHALSHRLSDAEREHFRFDIDDVEWRQYWLEVHVPGLEEWCLPLLRNDRVEDDPPFPRPSRSSAAEGVKVEAHESKPAPSRRLHEELR
ncbi:MAG: SDR family oxidoreductase [Deltaproteobacteria bacterium]|nr:SDR family oxidoreductase [Deltaproteobacteria bacterium]